MNKQHFKLCWIVAVLANAGAVADPPDREAAWKTIAPYFQPAAEFKDKFGSLDSPLIFDNGRKAESAADWPKAPPRDSRRLDATDGSLAESA